MTSSHLPLSIESNNLSTRTIITDINAEFDYITIFEKLPLHYLMSKYSCEIIAMYHKNQPKGNSKYFEKKKITSFRNAVNIIISKNNHEYNIKLSRWGRFQISGSKFLEETYICMQYLMDLIRLTCPESMTISPKNEPLKMSFTIVMTNYIYNAGFKIDKQKLNRLINQDASGKFYNLFETGFGYTGLNLKLKVDPSQFHLTIPIFLFENDKWTRSEKKYNSIGKTQKFNSFLVFHSGKIICSGMTEKTMNDDFLFFSSFLQTNKDKIQECIQ